jgi:hypothetical protein
MQRQAISEAFESAEIPPVVAAWCAQLLSSEFLALLQAFPAEQIDVRLSASKGRVRPKPVVVFNGGPSSLVEP